MTITETELSAARAAWGHGLVAISTAYDETGIDGARELAGGILDGLYGFEFGPILFKPTLSGGARHSEPTGTAPCPTSSGIIPHSPRTPASP